jgi:hypothetical protein
LLTTTQVGDQTISSGHFDNLTVTNMAPVSTYSGSGLGVTDAANRIVRSGLGGKVYRMTVVCTTGGGWDAGARQSEVEFLVRVGG